MGFKIEKTTRNPNDPTNQQNVYIDKKRPNKNSRRFHFGITFNKVNAKKSTIPAEISVPKSVGTDTKPRY